MFYDYQRLRGRIIERFGTITNLSIQSGISFHSISAKLRQKTDWRQYEIETLIKLLEIDRAEIPEYFFKLNGT